MIPGQAARWPTWKRPGRWRTGRARQTGLADRAGRRRRPGGCSRRIPAKLDPGGMLARTAVRGDVMAQQKRGLGKGLGALIPTAPPGSSAGARSGRLSRSFVVAEVALAFVLLAVGTVLVSELYHVTRVSPGFNPNHLLTFQISFAAEGIPGKPSQFAYQTRLFRSEERRV